jgi:putative DNA primase/helicase
MTLPTIETVAETALKWALKYTSLGIRVFPLKPGTKIPATPNGVKDASRDEAQIRAWWTDNPDYGVALAPEFKVGGACFLEFDQRPWLPTWAKEENQPKPQTRLHKSGGKDSPHYIFLHTEKSLELGNVNGAALGHEWFSFRADGRYVVAPPSQHPDTGKPYTVELDVEPAPIPDWLVAKIAKEGVSERKFSEGLRQVSEDFDDEAFFDWLERAGCKLGVADGAWVPFLVCPVAGRRHAGQGTRGCALFWDGGGLGFKCHAQGCPSNADRKNGQSGIGYLVSFLSREFEPYDGVIWDEETAEELADEFGAVKDELTEKPQPKPTPAKAQPIEEPREPTPEEKLVAEAEAIADKWEAQNPRPEQPEPEAKQPAGEFEVQAGTNNKGDIFQLMGTLASDIEPEPLEWLWQDKIPAGKITLFAGQPDCGKSLAMLDFVARITKGRDFPDGTPNPHGPKRVLLAATEDDLKSTLIPRLIAAEADLTKVVILRRVVVRSEAKQKTKRRMLQLAEDSKLLKLTLRNNSDIAVVALDPISSYFGGCDPNKDKEVRPVMEAIADACESSKTAFVGIIHNNKRGDADAIGKILGASSIVGVSRAVWGFARDKEKKGEYYMSLVKGNLARKRSGMKYQIVDATVVIDGKSEILPRTDWLGESEESADEVLQKNREAGEKHDSKIDVAKALIQAELEKQPRLAREMFSTGEKQNVSEETMRRAYRELGVYVRKQPGGPWWWSLTDEDEPWRTVPSKEKVMAAEEAL